jgi:hypothetical protein
VTTVVERDDEGYPYGPLGNIYLGGRYAKQRYGQIGDYLAWYEALGARPARKQEQEPEQEDGQNG